MFGKFSKIGVVLFLVVVVSCQHTTDGISNVINKPEVVTTQSGPLDNVVKQTEHIFPTAAPNKKLNYSIIGVMASEGCPNCIDILVMQDASNKTMKAIVDDLISIKGSKKLMIDFFTSRIDYKLHKDSGPYFANYTSFEDGNKMSYTLILNDETEIEF